MRSIDDYVLSRIHCLKNVLMLQILWLQDLKTKNGSKLKQKVEKTFQNYLFVVSFCRLTQRKEKKRKNGKISKIFRIAASDTKCCIKTRLYNFFLKRKSETKKENIFFVVIFLT